MKIATLKYSLAILLVIAFHPMVPHLVGDDYKLIVSKGEVVGTPANRFLQISIELKNNTDDTLKYFKWTCPQELFYYIESADLELPTTPECTGNMPSFIKIPPHQSKKDKMNLKFKNQALKSTIEYRLGFDLYNHPENYLENFYHLSTQNTPPAIPPIKLWSNTIKMKIDAMK